MAQVVNSGDIVTVKIGALDSGTIGRVTGMVKHENFEEELVQAEAIHPLGIYGQVLNWHVKSLTILSEIEASTFLKAESIYLASRK